MAQKRIFEGVTDINDTAFWDAVEMSVSPGRDQGKPPTNCGSSSCAPSRRLPSFITSRRFEKKQKTKSSSSSLWVKTPPFSPPNENLISPNPQLTPSRKLPAFITRGSSSAMANNDCAVVSTHSVHSNTDNKSSSPVWQQRKRRRLSMPVKIMIQLQRVDPQGLGYLIECTPPDTELEASILQISNTQRGRKGIWVPLSQRQGMDEAIEKLKKDAVRDRVQVNVFDVPRQVLAFIAKMDCGSSSSGKDPVVELPNILGRLPDKLRRTLYGFQKEGVRFAVNHHGRCMIGDEMGLGKTIQAIAIAAFYKDEWPLLVVCPSSLRLNWKIELIKWLPRLLSDVSVNVIMKGRDPLMGKFRGHTKAVVMSYDMVAKFQQQLDREDFAMIILDESHYIKSMQAKRTKAMLPLLDKARRVVLLTGTPALSRPIELYSQVKSLVPKLWGSMRNFGVRYCGGRKGRWGWEFKGAENLKELNYLLTRFVMIRRLKKEVLSQLKPKTRTAIMVQCSTSKLKKLSVRVTKLNAVLASLVSRGSVGDSNGNGNDKNPQSLSVSNDQHQAVIQMYQETGFAKVKAVWQYVSDLLDSGAKLLVFAHHQGVLDDLESQLINKRVGYFRIDGKTPVDKRQKGVDEFQASPVCRVALLSITAGGTGLTLTAANKVVFAELYWTPALLQQAEDRVHRIGQKSNVNISYVIGLGTLDEKLWPMVCRKLEVLGETLGGSKQKIAFEEVKDHTQQTGASSEESISEFEGDIRRFIEENAI